MESFSIQKAMRNPSMLEPTEPPHQWKHLVDRNGKGHAIFPIHTPDARRLVAFEAEGLIARGIWCSIPGNSSLCEIIRNSTFRDGNVIFEMPELEQATERNHNWIAAPIIEIHPEFLRAEEPEGYAAFLTDVLKGRERKGKELRFHISIEVFRPGPIRENFEDPAIAVPLTGFTQALISNEEPRS